jgi:hypothetical protein
MWKKENNDQNSYLKVPRASFILIQIEVRHRVNVNKVLQLSICSSDRAETDEDFQIMFEYTEYWMPKHFNNIISQKGWKAKGKARGN